MPSIDAAVVGSGPNGLAAAVWLARAGLRVRVHEAQPAFGGGTRTEERTLPGFHHDVCSAIHPMGAASPVFAELKLQEHGLEWIQPPVAAAHPLDDGTAVALMRSLDETADGLGRDGPSYLRWVAPIAAHFHELLGDVFAPVLRVPQHPFLMARFGLRAMRSAEGLGQRFEGERVRAMLAGLAAHAMMPLDSPFTASFALVFAATAHTTGWPLAKGGSQQISAAMVDALRELGGEVVTSDRIDSLEQLGGARAVLFDTSAEILNAVAKDRLPASYRRALGRFRRGPGVFKIDYALSGPVPWTAPECRSAGTVHLGGKFDEVAASLVDVEKGRHPERPFVLIAQQSLFDPTRAPEGKHTFWAYCHVPRGSTVDMTGRIEAQIERFAPGFKDLILARSTMNCAQVEAHNANYAGGDIGIGATDGLQLFARPTLSFDPYATPAEGIYLCSSATPPGPGVHGMCGYGAAKSALRRTFWKTR